MMMKMSVTRKALRTMTTTTRLLWTMMDADFWNQDDDGDSDAELDLGADEFDDNFDGDGDDDDDDDKAMLNGKAPATTPKTVGHAVSDADGRKLSKHQRRLLRQKEAGAQPNRKRSHSESTVARTFRDPTFYMAYTQSGAAASKAYDIDGDSTTKPLVKGAFRSTPF
jgi:hypothetical protein